MSTLEARNITFAYKGKQTIFNNLSLTVSSKERLGITAPSGHGKTTLCQLLAGYLYPSQGQILLDGSPIVCHARKPNPVQLIWQHPEQALDPYLRIERSLHEAGSIPSEILEGLGIKTTWLSRYPHELSGGELQRCCIARALAAKPQFLICDETTTMLDAVTQAQIWEFLLDYCSRESIGMLVVTHSPALMSRIATRVADLSAL